MPLRKRGPLETERPDPCFIELEEGGGDGRASREVRRAVCCDELENLRRDSVGEPGVLIEVVRGEDVRDRSAEADRPFGISCESDVGLSVPASPSRRGMRPRSKLDVVEPGAGALFQPDPECSASEREFAVLAAVFDDACRPR